jgi:hypothetical protein
MNPFQSLRDYEIFVYSLPDQFPSVLYSMLVVAQRGRYYAELTGEIVFPNDFRLVVYERLSWDAGSLLIEGYSYEAWHGSAELYWYDSQPHPNDPILASTHPHHKHIPPDIKHHRSPAPDLSFTAPNLPALIREIDTLLPK